MTAPATMVKRRLTINFQRSIKGGVPQVMEVVVAPLTNPSSPNNDATMVGGTQAQEVLLTNENNPVVFELVPTDSTDLTERLLYRIAWREKYMGRQFTQDFVMPDYDVEFDDLQNLGNIIGGETYLQWLDRLRPGGVAGLNQAGQVIDSLGNPVTGAEEADVVQGNLDVEVVARQQGDQFLRQYFLQFANEQVAGVYQSVAQNIAAEANARQNGDLVEKSARQNADAALHNEITELETLVTAADAQLQEQVDDHAEALTVKADLVNGKIPSDQIPSQALGHAVVVGDESDMLALTSEQVQVGDLAVRPDGTYILNGTDPGNINNWVMLSSAGVVSSVNGQTGTVVLSAANVGARALSQPVPMGDITGLAGALTGKTDNAVTNALTTRVTVIENDTTYVHTVGGVVPHAKHGNDVAFLNEDLQIVTKDGNVVTLTIEGGILDVGDVTGLQAELDSKLDITSPTVTNARTPTAHAASHQTGGTDAITPLPIGDITGLQAIVTNNSLTAGSNLGNRISTLETVVSGLSPGPGGTLPKAMWWDHTTTVGPTTNLADFAPVIQKSPFGKNAGGQFYYNPAGAAEGEHVFPYITPNGHLKLVARNETNPADPVPATQSDLTTLTSVVGTKADQASLDSTNANVNTKASQANLDATNATVATKADISTVNTLTTTVSTKANQSSLDTTNATMATKAAQSALDATNATVATKANQSDLTTTQGQVTALQAGKADLAGGVVPLAQIPALPTTKVTGLDAILANKAELSGGTLLVSQVPQIPTTKVTDLDNKLANKADLVGGLIPTAQLPALAYNTTVVVGSKAAMLALTPVQVQPGDVCVISATADQGSYILNTTDPSVFSNWVLLSVPSGTEVTTVNGQTGTVVLSASDVGARSSAVPILQSEITGLTATLGTKADTTALTAGLATKTSPADVDARISQSSNNKMPANLVATSAVPTLSGQQSIDGVLAPLGATVLLTNQSSSVNNGLYLVSSGAWARLTDMANGEYFLKGTLIIVTGGTVHHDTFWQQTSPSGVVGTNANNWIKTVTAGTPTVYTASLGIQKVVNDFRAQVVAGGGINAVAGGLQLDPNVAVRKVALDVPAGSTVVSITHNLNTTDIAASFRDKASGDAVLLGWKPNGLNAISAEFDSPPAAAQYRVVICG